MERWIEGIKSQIGNVGVNFSHTTVRGLISRVEYLEAQLAQAQRAIRVKDEELRIINEGYFEERTDQLLATDGSEEERNA